MRGGRGASREAGGPVLCGGGTTSGMHGDGLTLKGLGAKGTRGAHPEHGVHGRDAGGVEAQRLVEGRRALPSRREGMRCGRERWEPGGGRAWGAWWRHNTRSMHGEKARPKAWGPRARAERTLNMRAMSVTLEVSHQPEMSALKFFKLWKSSRMSVMAEMHQSAMGPYFAMAEAAFELNSVTAVFREALVVKVSPMQASEGEGGSGEGGGVEGDEEGSGGVGGGGGQLPGAQPEP